MHYDPLRAEKDMEVGKYYLKKGDMDAASDHFQDATEAKPGCAIPFLYLGGAYEKKEAGGESLPAVSGFVSTRRGWGQDPKEDCEVA